MKENNCKINTKAIIINSNKKNKKGECYCGCDDCGMLRHCGGIYCYA